MTASRRAAIPTAPSTCEPSESGPRWWSVADMRRNRSGSTAPRVDTSPQIPHMRSSVGMGSSGTTGDRLAQHAEGGEDHGPQIEPHGAVGDPFEIVRELLRHRGLVAVAHLRESGEPGPHDQSLPVGGEVTGELGEEARADRARADERHVAAQDVPELRDLVELRRLQPAADAGQLRVGSAHELLAEVLADSLLCTLLQRAEFQ